MSEPRGSRWRADYFWWPLLAALAFLNLPKVPAEAGPPAGGSTQRGLAGEPALDPDDLDRLLEAAESDVGQLARVNVAAPALDVTVSSVARQESTVGRSPAAVFVVSNEMIRRSGARSIPEVLRTVPGVDVARINANQWAVSIRGFNGLYANKLLVQIDGRSIYTPMFSGVFWDQNDVLLEDVERIEVIRGPGATVWGANAVNGIINVITKKASDTQGALVEGGGGTEERGFGSFRYGGRAGDSLYWRISGKQFERSDAFRPGGAEDDWRRSQIGLRLDWEPSRCTTFTLSSDYYQGTSGQRFDGAMPTLPFWQVGTNKDEEPSGCDVLMRLARKLDEDSDWAIQLYYDRAERSVENIGFYHSCDTFDLDFQHRFPLGRRHSLIWGFGYRNTRNVSQGVYVVSFDPAVRSFGILSYFVQDEITLRDDLLYLTVGSKFEHNDFSNFEYQPTVRLLWTPSERQSVWASVSRAVRTPSRTEHDILVTGAPLGFSFAPPGATFMCIEGDPAVESEELLAYEIGVRTQPSDDFWWDLAVFYNDYENLVALAPATPFPPTPAFPPALWQMLYANAMRGETYGFELAATCQVNPCWKVQGGYSLLKMLLHADADASSDAEDAEGESPQNQVYLQSGWDLGRGVELDVTGRYVDGLPALGIPDYVVMDVRLAWSPTKTLEMAVAGRHLLDAAHAEFDERSFYSSEVQSEVYGMVTWRH